MYVNLQRPAQRKQEKERQVIGPKAASHGLPFANVKMWRDEVRRDMLRPFLIWRYGSRGQHRSEIASFQNPYAIGPNLIVTIPPGLHEEKNTDEYCVYRNCEVGVTRRAENKGQCRTRRDHSPVRGGIEPSAPDVRALHFAAVKMDHRRVKLGRFEFLCDRDRCRFRLLVSTAHFVRQCSKCIRYRGRVNVVVNGYCAVPNLIFHKPGWWKSRGEKSFPSE